jgi:hypothetical protein
MLKEGRGENRVATILIHASHVSDRWRQPLSRRLLTCVLLLLLCRRSMPSHLPHHPRPCLRPLKHKPIKPFLIPPQPINNRLKHHSKNKRPSLLTLLVENPCIHATKRNRPIASSPLLFSGSFPTALLLHMFLETELGSPPGLRGVSVTMARRLREGVGSGPFLSEKRESGDFTQAKICNGPIR